MYQRVFLSFTIKTLSKLITLWLVTISYLYTYPHVLLQRTHPEARHEVKLEATGFSPNVCYKGWVGGYQRGSRKADRVVRVFFLTYIFFYLHFFGYIFLFHFIKKNLRYLFIFIFGCVGPLLLHTGFL